jgi:hypothetical protein
MYRLLILLSIIASRVASAQSLPRPDWPGLSAKAHEQIHEVDSAVAPIATVDAARSAGFGPVFGWIPTMGTHWVNQMRMFGGARFDLTSPSQLMFSPVNGKQTLVGVAFAYFAPVSDTTHPESFDGNPPWHEHPDLAPPGSRLVMLHLWLVPSPDGAFAGHNPLLPFWALGLTPPEADRFADAAESVRIRRAALALSAVADSNGLFPVLAQRPVVHAVLVSEGDSIRALIPQLDAAQKAGDWTRWDAIATQLGAHWDVIRDAYLKSAVNPRVNERMTKLMDEMATPSHTAHVH